MVHCIGYEHEDDSFFDLVFFLVFDPQMFYYDLQSMETAGTEIRMEPLVFASPLNLSPMSMTTTTTNHNNKSKNVLIN